MFAYTKHKEMHAYTQHKHTLEACTSALTAATAAPLVGSGGWSVAGAGAGGTEGRTSGDSSRSSCCPTAQSLPYAYARAQNKGWVSGCDA